MSRRTLIIGLGSDFGDDQAGLIAAQRLEQTQNGAAVRRLRSAASVLDLLGDLEELHIIDACHGAGEIGAIINCIWPTSRLTGLRFTGTHDFDLIAALRLADELCLCPARVAIWGIEVDETAARKSHSPVSPAVAAAIDRLVAQLTAELQVGAQHA